MCLSVSFCMAAQPELACLSGESVNEIFKSRLEKSGRCFIIIVGEGVSKNGFTSEDWEASIWNDQEFAQYLHDNKMAVVYMDAKTNPAYYSTLDIGSVPTILFIDQLEVVSTRHGLGRASDKMRDDMIKWIDAILSGKTLVDKAYLAVHQDPENIELRQNLMKELGDERRESEYTTQICWLLENNESYKEYLSEQYLENENTELSEEEFRAWILWQVMSLRDNLGLYKQASIGNRPEIDGWSRQVSLLESSKKQPWRKLYSSHQNSLQRIQTVFGLRQTLESKRDEDTASDRDLFILKALTAEGDESQALVDQYQPYFK